MPVFVGIPWNAKFLGKTSQSDFPEYPPLVGYVEVFWNHSMRTIGVCEKNCDTSCIVSLSVLQVINWVWTILICTAKLTRKSLVRYSPRKYTKYQVKHEERSQDDKRYKVHDVKWRAQCIISLKQKNALESDWHDIHMMSAEQVQLYREVQHSGIMYSQFGVGPLLYFCY